MKLDFENYRNEKARGSAISDKAIVMEHVSKAYTAGVPALNDVTLHYK